MRCDHLMGWDGVGGGREFQEGRTHVYLWLIHVDGWQKPTQHGKAIILQLKISEFFFKKESLWFKSSEDIHIRKTYSLLAELKFNVL